MDEMGEAMLTARAMPWATTEFVLMFLTWAIMMVAMMLPSAAPMILLFATVNRRRRAHGTPCAADRCCSQQGMSASGPPSALRPPFSNRLCTGWGFSRR